MEKVLVIYASKYGATVGIAKRIGEVLNKSGLQVDVLSANDVKDPTVYDAVVFGSAIYFGLWRKEATKFLKANEKTLSKMPLWIFSSGPTGQGDPVKLVQGHLFPQSLNRLIERIKPRDITVFHGKADEGKMNNFEKFVLKKVGAESGDFRDWNLIDSWSQSIADKIINTN